MAYWLSLVIAHSLELFSPTGNKFAPKGIGFSLRFTDSCQLLELHTKD